jgi:hypothetical protein
MTNLRWRVETNWSLPFQLSAALTGLILIGLFNPGEAFQHTAAPRPLGELEMLAGPIQCEGGECYDIRVTCPEVAAPARGRLKVGAAGGKSPRGTILFTTGNLGAAWYESAGTGESRRMLAELSAAGFRTVQLQWVDSWLFASSGKEEGHVRLGCRPATVARWVHDHLYEAAPSTAFCATGNSGGADQISYMLSHYGLKEILAAVVPTGGPPLARIDRSCNWRDPANASVAIPEVMRTVVDAGFGFLPPGDPRNFNSNNIPATAPCTSGDASFREKFRQASVASGEGDYVYPRTMVWFVFEGIDSSHAAAMGAAYYELLMRAGSPLVGKTVVPGVDHGGLIRNPTAVEKIREVLLKECRSRTR